MKTNMRIVLVSIAFLAIASGCVKENQMPNNEGANHKVTIFASIPDEGMDTKVTPSQDVIKTAVKLAWENTDYIYVNSEKFSVVTISADGKTAEFSGNDPGSGPYNISYSKDFSSVVDQTQTQDGTLDHLKYAAAISGADSYENLSFSSAWATAHGATFTSSSVLELRAKLPASIASSVKKVIFTFPENITVDNKRITVSLTTPGVQSGDNILDVYATLPDGNINLPNILVQFQVGDNAYEKYSAYREFASTNVIAGGTTQYLGIDCTKIESYANASSTNIGESTNPYLIGDKFQMDYLHTAMKTGTTYVKLVDDVDLNSEAWTPLNTSSPYDKGIVFNGNGKTIKKLSSSGKYASFAGVLYGSIYNVIFDSANISSDQTNSGVVAGYIGTGTSTLKGSLSNITVKHSNISSTANYVGGIAARVANIDGNIVGCKVFDTEISGAQYVGGLFGYIAMACNVEKSYFSGSVSASGNISGGLVGSTANVVIIIRNCYTTGTVSGGAGTQRVGGIAGELGEGGSVVNCYSTAAVSAARVCGGIVGRACGGTWDTTKASNNTISGCIAFNSAVKATAKGDYGSSGAVVGFTSCKNILSDCYRVYNMDYSNSNNTTEFITTMVDQPNCDGKNWTQGTTVGTMAPNQCPYYGKVAANEATVKSIAIALGWDDTIWDFSTDLPTLK